MKLNVKMNVMIPFFIHFKYLYIMYVRVESQLKICFYLYFFYTSFFAVLFFYSVLQDKFD